MRSFWIIISCLAAGSGLGACGKADLVQSCEDRREPCEEAVAHDKIRVPGDLDEPDRLKELPLPEAAPSAARPADSPCLELPPGVAPTQGQQQDEQDDEEDDG